MSECDQIPVAILQNLLTPESRKGRDMASELTSLFYPLGVWSFLYVILSWIIQCAIAIYGNFYASIPQLGMYWSNILNIED